MHAGHAGKVVTRERFIPIHSIANRLGDKVCSCLPAVHSLTGSDTTNGMYKIGKRTAFKKLSEHTDEVELLSEFGVSLSQDTAVSEARQFALLLYSKEKKPHGTLDELRYRLASTTDKTGARLPPTEDAFRQHALRAQYQTSIWCQSHVEAPVLKDPTECAAG